MVKQRSRGREQLRQHPSCRGTFLLNVENEQKNVTVRRNQLLARSLSCLNSILGTAPCQLTSNLAA
jgi:hypothetical protein